MMVKRYLPTIDHEPALLAGEREDRGGKSGDFIFINRLIFILNIGEENEQTVICCCNSFRNYFQLQCYGRET